MIELVIDLAIYTLNDCRACHYIYIYFILLIISYDRLHDSACRLPVVPVVI
jgi:hypothetical protein